MSLKEDIERAKKGVKTAEAILLHHLKQCTHTFVKRSKSSDTAVCDVCGMHGGWYCPESPTHICDYEHYDGEMGYYYHDEDDCIHYHEPEERK
jgi:hypothetical protein